MFRGSAQWRQRFIRRATDHAAKSEIPEKEDPGVKAADQPDRGVLCFLLARSSSGQGTTSDAKPLPQHVKIDGKPDRSSLATTKVLRRGVVLLRCHLWRTGGGYRGVPVYCRQGHLLLQERPPWRSFFFFFYHEDRAAVAEDRAGSTLGRRERRNFCHPSPPPLSSTVTAVTTILVALCPELSVLFVREATIVSEGTRE